MCFFRESPEDEEINMEATVTIERNDPNVTRDLSKWKKFRTCMLWLVCTLLTLIIGMGVAIFQLMIQINLHKRAVDRAVIMLTHYHQQLDDCSN